MVPVVKNTTEHSGSVRIDVFHNFPPSGDDSSAGKIEQVISLLKSLGAKVSELSDAVDAVIANEADEDAQQAAALAAKDQVIADLQAQLATSQANEMAALANDAADAQAIADKQAEIDALNADTQAQIDRLNEAFPPVTPA